MGGTRIKKFDIIRALAKILKFPTSLQNNVPHVQDIRIHTPGIEKLLKDFNPNKAAGVDDISPESLRNSLMNWLQSSV